ncbi:MAG TPA: flagellar assembly protein FliH [Roseateles sp.]|nr:flagellar assembly protein FliH [Roseateles sp.]HWT53462.1 flagellar assembly protein FliH [Rhodocyclaceae bacterium]
MSETPKRPEEMSAWERWEMASFDPPKPQPAPAPPPPPPPSVAEEPPEPAVKLPTAAEVDAIYSQARDEGYRVGFNEGQQTALTEAQKLAALVQKLDEAMVGMEVAVAEELLALSLEVARQVVRETVRLQPEAILVVVKEALLQLPHQHATIYLHPDDAALVRIHLGEQLAHAGHRVQDDPALARGDCTIDAGSTHVDATLASRWQRVVAGLGGTLQLNPHDEE